MNFAAIEVDVYVLDGFFLAEDFRHSAGAEITDHPVYFGRDHSLSGGARFVLMSLVSECDRRSE